MNPPAHGKPLALQRLPLSHPPMLSMSSQGSIIEGFIFYLAAI
jgi:hypothetical protein